MDVLNFLRAQWDRVAGVATVVGGAIVLFVGYLGVSGTSYPAEQLPYIISAGLVGLLLVACGGTLWLSADLRDEWLMLSDIRSELQRLQPEVAPEPEAAALDAETPAPRSTRRRSAQP